MTTLTGSFVPFDIFPQSLAHKIHNLNADTIMCAITKDAPDVTNVTFATDITETDSNGYTAGGYALTKLASFQQGGVYRFAVNDLTITAVGGEIRGRYLVIYNASAGGSNDLICFLDAGAEFVAASGKTLPVNFGEYLFSSQLGA